MQLGSCVAVAQVQACGYSSDSTLTWEPPYAASAALERQKRKKKKEYMADMNRSSQTQAYKIHFLMFLLIADSSLYRFFFLFFGFFFFAVARNSLMWAFSSQTRD